MHIRFGTIDKFLYLVQFQVDHFSQQVKVVYIYIYIYKIVVAFILGCYCGVLLKGSFNSVLPRLLFFCCYQTSSFCITLYPSFPPSTSARIGSPPSSWRWRRRCYRRPVDTYHINRVPMTDWGMTSVGACASVETSLKTCLELPKSRYLIFLYSDLMDKFESSWRVDDHPWNSNATCESSRVIILKSRLNSTGHSPCTSEVRDIFDCQTFVPNVWWQLRCSNVL